MSTAQEPPPGILPGDTVTVLLVGPHHGKRGLVVSLRGDVWADVYLFGSGSAAPVAFPPAALRVQAPEGGQE